MPHHILQANSDGHNLSVCQSYLGGVKIISLNGFGPSIADFVLCIYCILSFMFLCIMGIRDRMRMVRGKIETSKALITRFHLFIFIGFGVFFVMSFIFHAFDTWRIGEPTNIQFNVEEHLKELEESEGESIASRMTSYIASVVMLGVFEAIDVLCTLFLPFYFVQQVPLMLAAWKLSIVSSTGTRPIRLAFCASACIGVLFGATKVIVKVEFRDQEGALGFIHMYYAAKEIFVVLFHSTMMTVKLRQHSIRFSTHKEWRWLTVGRHNNRLLKLRKKGMLSSLAPSLARFPHGSSRTEQEQDAFVHVNRERTGATGEEQEGDQGDHLSRKDMRKYDGDSITKEGEQPAAYGSIQGSSYSSFMSEAEKLEREASIGIMTAGHSETSRMIEAQGLAKRDQRSTERLRAQSASVMRAPSGRDGTGRSERPERGRRGVTTAVSTLSYNSIQSASGLGMYLGGIADPGHGTTDASGPQTYPLRKAIFVFSGPRLAVATILLAGNLTLAVQLQNEAGLCLIGVGISLFYLVTPVLIWLSLRVDAQYWRGIGTATYMVHLNSEMFSGDKQRDRDRTLPVLLQSLLVTRHSRNKQKRRKQNEKKKMQEVRERQTPRRDASGKDKTRGWCCFRRGLSTEATGALINGGSSDGEDAETNNDVQRRRYTFGGGQGDGQGDSRTALVPHHGEHAPYGLDDALSIEDSLLSPAPGARKESDLTFSLVLIDSVIARGATSTVRRGTWRGIPVAVKMVPLMRITPDSIAELYFEARMACILHHRNIVPCVGVIVDPPSICLVQELCSRGSLYSFLHKTGRLSWERKLSMMIDCANALAHLHTFVVAESTIISLLAQRQGHDLQSYLDEQDMAFLDVDVGQDDGLHSSTAAREGDFAEPNFFSGLTAREGSMHTLAVPQGLVHCDIKSFNYLVCSDLTVKLSDFADLQPAFGQPPTRPQGPTSPQLARQHNTTTLPPLMTDYSPSSFDIRQVASEGRGILRGTPQWLPPEVFHLRRNSRASDVYSLGVVIWEIATQKTPLKRRGRFECEKAILERRGHAFLLFFDTIPVPLRNLIARLLEPNPSLRPAAQAVADTLVELREHLEWLSPSNDGEDERNGR